MKKKDTYTRNLIPYDVPKMVEGYYSGDKPNLNLRSFVEKHLRENSYDSMTDNYEIPSFAVPLSVTNRRDPINDLHIYWSKKPYSAIREYIRHYTKPGDLVVDPFCGSGGTALAALMEGRKAIAIDRSPAATFITKNYCEPVNTTSLENELRKFELRIKPTLDDLYTTRCHETDRPAQIAYTVYSQVYGCSRCLNRVPLYDCIQHEKSAKKGEKIIKTNLCPECYSKGIIEEINVRCPRYGVIPVYVSYVYSQNGKTKRNGRSHIDANPKARAFFKEYDLRKLEDIDKAPIPFWVPNIPMMNHNGDDQRWGLLWRPYLSGIRTVADLYTKRNLIALAHLKDAIDKSGTEKERLLFLFSGLLYNASKMYQEREAGGGPAKGTYYTPPVFREVAVWTLFTQKSNNLLKAAEYWNPGSALIDVIISTQSATNLSEILDKSVDYIFTDPPYSWKVQYGESNFLWEAWLGFDTKWHNEEIIVNDFRGATEMRWSEMIKQAMAECYRILKPGRWLSLCYHDTSEGTWDLIQNIMTEVGFIVEAGESTLFIETGQKAWKQIVADKINKRDLVINFHKPKLSTANSNAVPSRVENDATFGDLVKTIIREYLIAHPGTTKDRIYDELVSRMVRKGKMEAHDFERLLLDVAEEERQPVRKNLIENEPPNLFGTHLMRRWYLKESEAGAYEAEQVTADDAATRIYDFLRQTTTSRMMESESVIVKLTAEKARLRERLRSVDQGVSSESRGKLVRDLREISDREEKLEAQQSEWRLQAVHYSDIFEFYVTGVNPKPKATLEELLEDYCYHTDTGNWRPPLTDEEKREKSGERQRAVRRQIQRLYKLLEGGQAVPESLRPDTPTLVEWIRHCRRTGLHLQGKLLYEQGGLDLNTLNEEDQVNVEEDYQVCVRSLNR